MKTGSLGVKSENIFPIIRQWLYSEKDIFVRELISNGADALQKRKRGIDLHQLPQADRELRIHLFFEGKSLVFEDNGIGMTEDEVEKYINQIAFSGLQDYVDKYFQGKKEDSKIIGHFGLGFYSAFITASKVSFETLSAEEGAKPVRWESEDGVHYTMSEGSRTEVGTRIVVELNSEGQSLIPTAERFKAIVTHYCQFLPWPIYMGDGATAADDQGCQDPACQHHHGEDTCQDPECTCHHEHHHEHHDEECCQDPECTCGHHSKFEGHVEGSESEEAGEAKANQEPSEKAKVLPGPIPINQPNPLWLKRPAECTDEEYIKFYQDTFFTTQVPLFWTHIYMDYPFRVQGILYFPPKMSLGEKMEGRIKIYYNQVFVEDNISEIIPEYLFLLQGCLDCPDLPLNVSRSFLQNDPYVQKISQYLVRKVGDTIKDYYKNQRTKYEEAWPQLEDFIKIGLLQDEKFYDKVHPQILFPLSSLSQKFMDKKVLAFEELSEGDQIYVTDDEGFLPAQALVAKEKKPVLLLDKGIDLRLMSAIEYHTQAKYRFVRVDTDQAQGWETDTTAKVPETLVQLFQEISQMPQLEVEFAKIKTSAPTKEQTPKEDENEGQDGEEAKQASEAKEAEELTNTQAADPDVKAKEADQASSEASSVAAPNIPAHLADFPLHMASDEEINRFTAIKKEAEELAVNHPDQRDAFLSSLNQILQDLDRPPKLLLCKDHQLIARLILWADLADKKEETRQLAAWLWNLMTLAGEGLAADQLGNFLKEGLDLASYI